MVDGSEARRSFNASLAMSLTEMGLYSCSDWRLNVRIWRTSSLARMPALNISLRYWKEAFLTHMTFVTSKIWSSSLGSNLHFAVPWCFCVPNLMRLHQIFFASWVETNLNDLLDLENMVKVTLFELCLCICLMLLCTKFSADMLFLQILSRSHLVYAANLNDLCDLEIRSRSSGSNLVFAFFWCFCVSYLVRIHQIFLQILNGNHFKWT